MVNPEVQAEVSGLEKTGRDLTRRHTTVLDDGFSYTDDRKLDAR